MYWRSTITVCVLYLRQGLKAKFLVDKKLSIALKILLIAEVGIGLGVLIRENFIQGCKSIHLVSA